jgi:hypothetical protein
MLVYICQQLKGISVILLMSLTCTVCNLVDNDPMYLQLSTKDHNAQISKGLSIPDDMSWSVAGYEVQQQEYEVLECAKDTASLLYIIFHNIYSSC